MLKIRLTETAVQQLAITHNPSIAKKITEYKAKPQLLETNLTLETAGVFKDFFKRYGVKLGHFRVGDDRVIGILKKDVFFIREFVPRGKLQKELERTMGKFPFDL